MCMKQQCSVKCYPNLSPFSPCPSPFSPCPFPFLSLPLPLSSCLSPFFLHPSPFPGCPSLRRFFKLKCPTFLMTPAKESTAFPLTVLFTLTNQISGRWVVETTSILTICQCPAGVVDLPFPFCFVTPQQMHTHPTPLVPHTLHASFLTHLILYTPHTVQTPHCTLPTLYTNHGTICVLIRSSCLSLLNTIGCLSPLCLCDCLLCLQDVPSGYRRLAPQQPVGLRHAGFTISVEKVTKVRQKCVGVNV